jgi:hypothetical protein
MSVWDSDSVELRGASCSEMSLFLPFIMRDERGGTRHEAMDECCDGLMEARTDFRNCRSRVDAR